MGNQIQEPQMRGIEEPFNHSVILKLPIGGVNLLNFRRPKGMTSRLFHARRVARAPRPTLKVEDD